MNYIYFQNLQILPKAPEKAGGKKTGSPRVSNFLDQALTCLIPDTSIFLYGKLGNGSFGVVRKGDWKTPSGEKVCKPVFFNMYTECLLNFHLLVLRQYDKSSIV